MSFPQYKFRDKLLVAVDCIIFGFDGLQIKALLVERDLEPGKGLNALMGGFVNSKESVQDAAKRVLNKLTGLTDTYMEQLACFGDEQRDPGGRVISIAYFALIKYPLLQNYHIHSHFLSMYFYFKINKKYTKIP